jgi:hypothetical protein
MGQVPGMALNGGGTDPHMVTNPHMVTVRDGGMAPTAMDTVTVGAMVAGMDGQAVPSVSAAAVTWTAVDGVTIVGTTAGGRRLRTVTWQERGSVCDRRRGGGGRKDGAGGATDRRRGGVVGCNCGRGKAPSATGDPFPRRLSGGDVSISGRSLSTWLASCPGTRSSGGEALSAEPASALRYTFTA